MVEHVGASAVVVVVVVVDRNLGAGGGWRFPIRGPKVSEPPDRTSGSAGRQPVVAGRLSPWGAWDGVGEGWLRPATTGPRLRLGLLHGGHAGQGALLDQVEEGVHDRGVELATL